jgi:hypothetical protein
MHWGCYQLLYAGWQACSPDKKYYASTALLVRGIPFNYSYSNRCGNAVQRARAPGAQGNLALHCMAFMRTCVLGGCVQFGWHRLGVFVTVIAFTVLLAKPPVGAVYRPTHISLVRTT